MMESVKPLEAAATRQTRQLMIVNGSSDVLEVLEPVLEPVHYDVVFVESGTSAYSKIKVVQPNLVILCLRMNDPEGFQLLTMLKLDPETARIPIVTCATELDGTEEQEDESERTDEDLWPSVKPSMSMN